MFSFIRKIFGTAQDRQVKKYAKLVEQVNKIEKEFQKLSEVELINKTNEFKDRYQKGESLDSLLFEAYAVVKNICRRLCGTEIHVSGYNQNWDMIPYDVQILGAIAMHNGTIAEMQTGEGKTITAAMPLYLNALTGKPVHLVTVNDYLAKRDCEWIGVVFKKLGLTVSPLTNDTPMHLRKEVYNSDIVYGTASEFGFDHLRDNSMATSIEEQVQRGYYFAIIDETDSILIDEARTPLIISGPCSDSKQMYDELKTTVFQLVRIQRDFCNKLASEAKRVINEFNLGSETEEKLKKEDLEKIDLAFKKLWLVSKGTPRNKILKRIRENPDLRAKVEKYETYYYSDQSKEEKSKELANLYIIVDERANDYELTDKGIQEWCTNSSKGLEEDFVMLDLGYEYAKIDDNPENSEKDKIQKKMDLREEDSKRKERSHNLRQLFRAHLLMEKDVDYIIQEQKIVIIDENTGRPQPGRRFSDGLHQSIEAKENLAVQGDTQTFATITLQNYFRMYNKLAGMTGTAITEAAEFKDIYKLEVLEIPTYCSCTRKDFDDEIYMTEREKYIAILKEIQKIHQEKRPILIGTESVEISEKLSRILKQNKLPHTILNAKNHTREAEIIADAGKIASITLSTNMAGRGTDIKLKENVQELGGLHVIGTTRHQSRRIDRQLRGRSGRLGDAGSSKFFVSFEDSLMRLFASPRLTSMLQRFRPPEGEPISAKVLNKSIETAQKRIEQRHSQMRKHTLEYDDVMNKQRKEIYSFRNDILSSKNPIDLAKDVLANICSLKTEEYFSIKDIEGRWDFKNFSNWLMTNFPITIDEKTFDNDYLSLEKIEKIIQDQIFELYEKKLSFQKQIIGEYYQDGNSDRTESILKDVITNLMIRKIDHLWQEHLLSIDHLRDDVNLRVVGQKDPLLEFKHEAFRLFDEFFQKLSLEIATDIFKFEMKKPEERSVEQMLNQLQMHQNQSFVPQPENAQNHLSNKTNTPITTPITREEPKAKRNEPCPCGSEKKYKKCCFKKEATV